MVKYDNNIAYLVFQTLNVLIIVKRSCCWIFGSCKAKKEFILRVETRITLVCVLTARVIDEDKLKQLSSHSFLSSDVVDEHKGAYRNLTVLPKSRRIFSVWAIPLWPVRNGVMNFPSD